MLFYRSFQDEVIHTVYVCCFSKLQLLVFKFLVQNFASLCFRFRFRSYLLLDRFLGWMMFSNNSLVVINVDNVIPHPPWLTHWFGLSLLGFNLEIRSFSGFIFISTMIGTSVSAQPILAAFLIFSFSYSLWLKHTLGWTYFISIGLFVIKVVKGFV